MRLGGAVFEKYNDPYSWIEAVKKCGYRAAYCPVDFQASDEEIKDYRNTAKAADVVIAEVGVWNNPLSSDVAERTEALNKCKKGLEVASKIGAKCCVNIAGARGARWDGPDAANFTRETFEMIVETVREIIDDVQPADSFYTLETMPWIYPDSPDSYLELIKAINRKAFAVHLDPVNMICSPQRYFNNTAFLKECFNKLGAHIKSCHAKDTIMLERFTVCIEETRPGKGFLDYGTFLRELDNLNADTPIMLEHLPSEEEYKLATEYVRSVAKNKRISV